MVIYLGKISRKNNFKLSKEIEEYRKVNPYIRAYLGASKGKEGFYEKFGFVSRPNDDLGPGMVLYKKD